jgi:hypothetical protein
MSIPESFWSRVDRSGECWVWTRTRSTGGYGRIYVGRHRWANAHRRAWELAYGPIPEGMVVCHKCDNPPCVRLDHLFLGTMRDNAQDALRKGRLQVGERNHQSRLTAAAAADIRRRWGAGELQVDLAREYDVHIMTVNDLVHGRTWRHLGLR